MKLFLKLKTTVNLDSSVMYNLFCTNNLTNKLKITVPDMVPTPITKHSTRASKVNVGPNTAIPRAIFSLTSSCEKRKKEKDWNPKINLPYVHPGKKHIQSKMFWVPLNIFCTWELELRANFARAHALDRSIRSRKKGSASLEDTPEK